MMYRLVFILLLSCTLSTSFGQHSVARQWNEILLEAIRNDFARPTVHARNLFHISAAMYDAWAIHDQEATPYFLKNHCPLVSFFSQEDRIAATEEALSYAVYRLINHRFKNSPGVNHVRRLADDKMDDFGFDINNTSQEYWNGAAELGNYLAACIISYGLTDGSNEQNDYSNLYYEPVNNPIFIEQSGNSSLNNPNRWQPIAFESFIDQAGNPIDDSTPDFLSPEWGNVKPFALKNIDLAIFERDGNEYLVYHDPGPPPTLENEEYKWGFCLVNTWSAHLDPTDEVMWDISPATIGNIETYPTSFQEYQSFYDFTEGGDGSVGWAENPHTGLPYEPQMVPRGDYARVLAEFWADGPDSETPPGHWFTILNYVNDHPELEKRLSGTGETLSDLEWDIKTYFTLGGTMHDVAVSVWGIKGWYDYVRPVSSIRYMASLGQSTDSNLPGYHPDGIPLVDGYVEVITDMSDPLAFDDKDIGRIKINAWKGPAYIFNPASDVAGVDWIYAEEWWPYQRPSFVTPPFAGYVSGHSTFSSAAAVVLSELTGSEFFPGGLGEFIAPKDEFLVFEDGPSVDVVLQWATYKDAADQCSLSRIWGGIHPPVDDIPGRKIGNIIGQDAVSNALMYFDGDISLESREEPFLLYPNPTKKFLILQSTNGEQFSFEVYDLYGKQVLSKSNQSTQAVVNIESLNKGMYMIKIQSNTSTETTRFVKN